MSSQVSAIDTPLIEVPHSVQILTRSLIEEQDRRTLAEALVNVSGVTPNRPEEGLLAGPLVRGLLPRLLPVFALTRLRQL